MDFFVGLILFSLLFVVVFVVGLYMVFYKTWLLVWLRANVGIFFLFFGLVGGVGLLLLSDMKTLAGEVVLGTAQTEQLGMNTQFIRINNERIGQRDVEITQPDWRVRALKVEWSGIFDFLGVNDGILLYDLQQTNGQGIIQTTILEHESVVKVWELSRAYLQWLPGVQFEFITTPWQSVELGSPHELLATRGGFSLRDRNRRAMPGTAQALFESEQSSSQEPITKSDANISGEMSIPQE